MISEHTKLRYHVKIMGTYVNVSTVALSFCAESTVFGSRSAASCLGNRDDEDNGKILTRLSSY